MKKILAIVFFSLLPAVVFADPWLPNPATTPGAINPAVTQANIQSTVCKHGWTKTIRPHVSYTNKLKKEQLKAAGLTGSMRSYEEDHLISLELGGSPTDPKNLWPEPWNGQWGAHKKDVIETRLKREVCEGHISLNEAQKEISTNWINAYKKYYK